MSKRPPKYPWNRVPTCQRPYKPCAVENVSSRYPGWSVHMGKIRKISSSVTEISVAETEISVTGPARLLIWTHRNFCKEKSGEARSRQPSQPGQPGSYEEALRQRTLWKNEKPITLLRFNEKSAFLHQNDCQIILYRLNKIILMRREKNFPCFFFLTNWVYDPGLIEFKTQSLRMPES